MSNNCDDKRRYVPSAILEVVSLVYLELIVCGTDARISVEMLYMDGVRHLQVFACLDSDGQLTHSRCENIASTHRITVVLDHIDPYVGVLPERA